MYISMYNKSNHSKL